MFLLKNFFIGRKILSELVTPNYSHLFIEENGKNDAGAERKAISTCVSPT